MQKLAFVTGAGRGIGRAIALELSKQGYVVSGCARTLSELEETKRLSEGKIRIFSLDATDLKAVKNWILSEMETTKATPWGLVVSAGTYGAIGAFTEVPFEEWEKGIELNLLAPAFTVQCFAQELIKRKLPGRVVMLSGGGATQPLPNFSNYCAAKSGIVRFAETLAHELKEHQIAVNTLAPGAINTRFLDDVLAAGPQKVGKMMYEKALKQKSAPPTGPEKAAELTAYLLREDTGMVTGRLISAVWDSWKTFHEKWKDIELTDWFTLKRTVPPQETA